jgi:FtsP/CotA-like multicopper oxidase with cupredoxin domain
MRIANVAVAGMIVIAASPMRGGLHFSPRRAAVEQISVNDNRTPAGTLANGVLTIRLEVREGEWHPTGDSEAGIIVRAFAEEGKPMRIPGPLIRVPEGTTIRAFVRNSLRDSTLVMQGLSPRGALVRAVADTVQIKPGVVRELRFDAGAAGTYYYRGSTNANVAPGRGTVDAELLGAFIVDPRGVTGPARDRVFVLGLWSRRGTPGGIVNRSQTLRFTINGKSWPNTERVAYNVGDTVRFRLINGSIAVHPMHLHGFYFNVESRGDGTRDSIFDRTGSLHRVVTERMTPGRTFTMSWVADRAGNWLFHCHDNFHVLRNSSLDDTQLVPENELHVHNHAIEMMGGLVMGIEVRDNGVALASTEPTPRRKLRLTARVDSGGTVTEPSYSYVLQDDARALSSYGASGMNPTILLKRGEPVSITVVNRLPEPTAVHWHGIELDSYYDGVADFSGRAGHIAPAIAPRDSFEARFTPPRSGTFIYHPHADEVRQQQAGLSGAIVVVDSLEKFDPEHDIVLLITVPRLKADSGSVLVNGVTSPPVRELRVGERYRIRVVDIHVFRPSMIMRLVTDAAPVSWRAIAKDGMDLPPDQATVRPAVQQMGNGETYDFELIPTTHANLRFTIESGAGVLLGEMPIRVR